MSTSLLADAFDHHIWATLTLIDACSALTPEQLDATTPGIYGSIIGTMRHLVGADSGYLELLSGGRVPIVDEEADLDLPTLRAAMERHAPVWSAVLADDPDPDRIVVRNRDDGSTSSAPMGIRLSQVVHHGTDHRSQICTVLTTLGVEPPPIDVWDFAWSQGRLAETVPTEAVAPAS